MTAPLLSAPGFGQADLSNCEREQIHLAGSIQPHGALLLLDEPAHRIIQASANATAFLGLEASVLGRVLGDVAPELDARIRAIGGDRLRLSPAAIRCRIGAGRRTYDGHLHRLPGGGIVVELERTGPPVNIARDLDAGLQAILAAPSLRILCDETARLFKDITGYDRVMVYRFDEEGHGEIFAEEREPGLEAYLGNHYPASDIPQIARRLYQRNRVRVLVDVGYEAVPLVPRACPLTGEDLDMSLCFLRSMSPIHIQYLKNMGVGATLVASLVVGGKLWGLIACHHYRPRVTHFEVRAMCEVLAEAVATRVAALESLLQAQAELWVRRLEQRMVEAISRDGDWRIALFDGSLSLLQAVDASGAALLFEGQILTGGDVPGTQELRDIGLWLDSQPRGRLVCTASFAADVPRFAALTPVASGLLAVPVSTLPGEYLVWFRPERVRTVTWGGNPFKPVVVGADPAQLSPRRSFAQWHQLVEGTSNPWAPADFVAARLIGESISDVVLQFRSVRMLIAQDQLDTVRRQVQLSDQPVLIAGPDGQILASNDAFAHLLGRPNPPRHVEDLLALMGNTPELRQRLREMVRHKRNWRGEVRFKADGEAPRMLLVRADAVFAGSERVLGFVLLFTDLTKATDAKAARRSFQEQVINTHRVVPGRLDSRADLLYHNLLAPVVENAQLAALEIAGGVDTAQIPGLLDSLRASVSRAAQTLERLIRHASDRRGG